MSFIDQLINFFKKEIVSTNKPKELLPMFDKRFKIIVKCEYNEYYYEMLNWINNNSNGMVEIKLSTTPYNMEYAVPPNIPWTKEVFVAFENTDDATFFKIKYKIGGK